MTRLGPPAPAPVLALALAVAWSLLGAAAASAPASAAAPARAAQASAAPAAVDDNETGPPAEAEVPTAGDPSAAASAPSAPTGVLGDADWSRRYVAARANMLAGRFADASAQFSVLAAGAREASQQLLAREQADICERWARGGLVLVRSFDLPALQARAREATIDRRSTDELGILYTGAVLYGLGAGITLDYWTNPSSAATGVLPVLGLGGAAAGLVYLIDNPEPLHYGVAQAITSGMWVGLEEGLAWTLWNQARATHSDEWSGRTVAAALWATATAGAVLGGTLGTAYGTTPGRASFTGSAALWSGLVVGLLAASAAGDAPTADDSFMLAGALGLNAGAVAGVIIGKEVAPSIARVRFIDLGALAGGILAGGLYLAASNGNPGTRVMTGVLAAGITGGLFASWQLTTGMEPDYPRTGRADPQAAVSAITPSLAPTTSAGRGHSGGIDGMVLGVAGGF